MIVRVATSQFSTTGEFRLNAERMISQIREARKLGADLIHFPESCLSGYPENDLPDFRGYDWDGLRAAALEISRVARAESLWVVFGSAHPLSAGHKPHNSLYIVDRSGNLVDRYDKRFCAGDSRGTIADLAHYTPGNRFVQFELEGVRFGTLICHEYRYPELYREHARHGTRVLLQSFHSGNISEGTLSRMEEAVGQPFHELNPATTIAGITQLTAAYGAASSNNLWISCSNSSAPRSCWGAFVVRPDGVCVGRLENERDGLLVTEIDAGAQYYDSTQPWRARAMSGQLHSGELVDDPRSRDRSSF